MSYKIYIANDCPACDRVLEYVTQNEVEHELVNVNDPGKEPVAGVLIYPALFAEDSLQAYGDDIITWLENSANSARA